MLLVAALSMSITLLPTEMAADVRDTLREEGYAVKSVECSATGNCRVELDSGGFNLKCDDAGCVVLPKGTAT
jgi:hypothetical protein